MNRKILYPILIIIVTVLLYYAEGYVDAQNDEYPENDPSLEEYTSFEFDDAFLPTSTTGEIVKHNYYTLSYSEKFEQAEWVAYPLNKNHLSQNNFERPYFVEDRSVPSNSADWRNYKKSGFDKGHLCPAGDRRFSFEAHQETFLTSNISPQNHKFNAGIWNKLEQKTRYWAKRYNGVYVITGGILNPGLKTIGDEKVAVPDQFYKIIMDASNDNYSLIAFLIPNAPVEGSFYNYTVSVDEIENLTGINFFPNLSEDIQIRLESKVNLENWGNR